MRPIIRDYFYSKEATWWVPLLGEGGGGLIMWFIFRANEVAVPLPPESCLPLWPHCSPKAFKSFLSASPHHTYEPFPLSAWFRSYSHMLILCLKFTNPHAASMEQKTDIFIFMNFNNHAKFEGLKSVSIFSILLSLGKKRVIRPHICA